MDHEQARLATGSQVAHLLGMLPPYSQVDALGWSARWRSQGIEPDVIAATLTQARLREAARAKLGDDAAHMVFTQDGMEQATRAQVAALHAQRYRTAGAGHVADLTAGIGADALAFAKAGLTVTAFERDEATALVAAHNLRAHPHATVVTGDSLELLARAGTADYDAVFADPARRDARGRRHDPADYSPRLDHVLALCERWPALGVKVGPGIPHGALPPSSGALPVEVQWVSVDGAVVEAGLWCGPLARLPGRTALVIRGEEQHLLHGSTAQAPTGPLQEWLVEPDGAVIRAGLVDELAGRLGGHLLHPSIAYLTAANPPRTAFGQVFRLVEAMPFHEKQLAQALRARGIGSLEIKKRGMDIDPAALRKRLRLAGNGHATVILTRVGSDRMALLVERVTA